MTDDQQSNQASPAPSAPDVPPDHLAINPRSPHYGGDLLTRGIGIEEYCVSEGWVKVQAGKTMDRKGNPLLIKLNGEVEAWFEDLGDEAPKLSRDT